MAMKVLLEGVVNRDDFDSRNLGLFVGMSSVTTVAWASVWQAVTIAIINADACVEVGIRDGAGVFSRRR